MAELVDAHGSGPCAARCGGSSPLLGTKKTVKKGRILRPFFFIRFCFCPEREALSGFPWGLERICLQANPGSRLRDRVFYSGRGVVRVSGLRRVQAPA